MPAMMRHNKLLSEGNSTGGRSQLKNHSPSRSWLHFEKVLFCRSFGPDSLIWKKDGPSKDLGPRPKTAVMFKNSSTLNWDQKETESLHRSLSTTTLCFLFSSDSQLTRSLSHAEPDGAIGFGAIFKDGFMLSTLQQSNLDMNKASLTLLRKGFSW